MKFDLKKNEVIINNKRIHLTNAELEILSNIYKSNNKTIKIDQLIKVIYKANPNKRLRENTRKQISLLNKKIFPTAMIRNVSKIGYYLDENLERKVQNDLKFIKREIITKKRNGNYCRYIKSANIVTHLGISEKTYKEYWIRRYAHYQERLPEILEACEKKLKQGLTSTEDFIKLVRNSDNPEEEKRKIIKSLGGKY